MLKPDAGGVYDHRRQRGRAAGPRFGGPLQDRGPGPREVPILRGEVLERQGGTRPGCVRELSPKYVRQLPWDHAKKEALSELRQTLDGMADSPEVRVLREKLDVMFPGK